MADSLDEQGFPKRQDNFGTQNPFVSPLAEEERGQGYGYITRPEEPLNPWVSMWTKPRETVRQQLDTDPEKHVLLVMALAGAVAQLSNGVSAQFPDFANRLGVLVGSAVGGAIWGVVSLYLISWLLGIAGRALGGVATAAQCRTAVGWSMIPTLWLFPLHLMMGVYHLQSGPNAFVVGAERAKDALPPDPLMVMVVFAFTGIQTVVGIWQLVIFCKATGEAHEFSAWRGFGAWLLVILVMMAFTFAVLILIGILVAVITISSR